MRWWDETANEWRGFTRNGFRPIPEREWDAFISAPFSPFVGEDRVRNSRRKNGLGPIPRACEMWDEIANEWQGFTRNRLGPIPEREWDGETGWNPFSTLRPDYKCKIKLLPKYIYKQVVRDKSGRGRGGVTFPLPDKYRRMFPVWLHPRSNRESRPDLGGPTESRLDLGRAHEASPGFFCQSYGP